MPVLVDGGDIYSIYVWKEDDVCSGRREGGKIVLPFCYYPLLLLPLHFVPHYPLGKEGGKNAWAVMLMRIPVLYHHE